MRGLEVWGFGSIKVQGLWARSPTFAGMHCLDIDSDRRTASLFLRYENANTWCVCVYRTVNITLLLTADSEQNNAYSK